LPSLLATDACRWVTKSIAHAPYVTQLDWISHFGCKYVVHGDDITSDSSGEDCYRFVKAAGRFKVVRRTPSISTTDLVGRMLLCTRGHFIRSLERVLAGEEGPGTEAERAENAAAMLERIRLYATDETARKPGAHVWFWRPEGGFRELFAGVGPRPGQRVVYVDGGFDLFSSGHIQFLRMVTEAEEELARQDGWYSEQAVNERRGKGADYGPVFVVAGVHDDEVINTWKGVNYPIMNIYERGLCVLQCRVGPAPDQRCRVDTQRAFADAPIVCPCRHLRRAVHAHQEVSYLAPLGHARCCLSWPDVLHAFHHRRLRRAQGDGHLPRDWPPRV
jgi:ethanolamine-phosphate cytidylyltransferase